MVGELEVRAGEIAKELEAAAENRKAANEADFAGMGFVAAKPKALDGEILTGPYKGERLRRGRIIPDDWEKPKPAAAPQAPQATGPFQETEAAPKASAEPKPAPEAEPEAEPQGEAEPDAEPPPSGKGVMGPKMSKLVATMERHPPLSFFQYSRTPTGIVGSLENAMIAVKALKLDCRYDEFHDVVIVKGYENTASGDALENLDNTLAKLREKVLRTWGFRSGERLLSRRPKDRMPRPRLRSCSRLSRRAEVGWQAPD